MTRFPSVATRRPRFTPTTTLIGLLLMLLPLLLIHGPGGVGKKIQDNHIEFVGATSVQAVGKPELEKPEGQPSGTPDVWWEGSRLHVACGRHGDTGVAKYWKELSSVYISTQKKQEFQKLNFFVHNLELELKFDGAGRGASRTVRVPNLYLGQLGVRLWPDNFWTIGGGPNCVTGTYDWPVGAPTLCCPAAEVGDAGDKAIYVTFYTVPTSWPWPLSQYKTDKLKVTADLTPCTP